MSKKKTSELKPNKSVVHFTDTEHELLSAIAREQGRTISGQIYFWVLEKLKLKEQSIKKEVFFNGKV